MNNGIKAILIVGCIAVLIASLCIFSDCLSGSASIVDALAEESREVLVREDVEDVPPMRSISSTLPDDGIVGDNIILNSGFTDPIYSRPSSMNNVTNQGFYNWYASNVSYSDGISFSIVNRDYCGLNYYVIFPSVGTYTITFRLKNSARFTYGLREIINGSVSAHGFGTISTVHSDWYLVTYTFDVTNLDNKYYFFFWNVTVDGDYSMQWLKVESGSSFTGYVPNSYSVNGWNSGYQSGATDGWNSWYNSYCRYYDGWTNGQSAFYDFISSDQSELISVSGAGSVLFAQANGLVLTSSADGTVFSFDMDISRFSYSDLILTFALNIVFDNLPYGSVVVSFDYMDNGGNIFTEVITPYSYEHVVVSTKYACRRYFSGFHITVAANCSVILRAAKIEVGEYFTRFPRNADPASGWNSGYTAGYSVGYMTGNEEGYESGSMQGYDEGYAVGWDRGSASGYSEGLSVANNGSFFSLVTALVDAPVNTFTSLLDFDILGLNMMKVARVFLTIALFVFLVKFLIGKFGK